MTVQFYKNSIASANLVDYKVFREIHRECQIFDKTFKLGSTACMCYTIKVTKGGLGNFSSLLAVDDGVRVATLEVDSVDTENEQYDEYVLVDYMVRFNEPYDGSQVVGTSGCTLLQLLQDICSKHNVTLDSGSTQFIGYNKNINWYDSTITAREYIGYIAELNGGMAYITGDGKLAFKQFKSSTASKGTILVTQLSSWKLGNQVMVTRVVYDTHTGIMWSAGTDTNNTVYVSTNNVYITEEADITNIYNVVNGFTFYSVKTGKCPIVQNAQPGDIITFMDTEANTYNTIVQINQDYMLGWLGSYELQIANEFQEETQVIDSKTMIKTIKTTIDREVGEISSTVASVQETVEDVQGDVGTLQGDVGELGDSLDGVNTQITTINNNVSNITQTTSNIQTQVTQTQTTLKNDYATKEQLSSSVSSLSTTIEQTAQDLTIDINKVKTTTTEQGEEISQINSYFEFSSDGLTIGKSDSEVRLRLENDELNFIDNSRTLAWLDSSDGLGANALSIGDATTASNRWRVFTRENGSHLTFTRHS